VQRALDAAVFQVAVGQQRVLVRADVVGDEVLVVAAIDGELAVPQRERHDLVVLQAVRGVDFNPCHGDLRELYLSVC
jgi:hypothetical protein